MNEIYEDTYHKLREEKLVAWLLVDMDSRVSGIDVDCPGIDSLKRTATVMKIVGNSYKVVFLPNDGIIKVELKEI